MGLLDGLVGKVFESLGLGSTGNQQLMNAVISMLTNKQAGGLSGNWSADIRNASQNYGLGARWKPMPRLETGGDVTYAFDSAKHDLGVISGLSQVASLPEYDYRHTRLKLFAKYAVRPDAGLRVEYIYDRWRTDDWTWTNWAYADGTTVSQDPNQNVNFIGVSGYYHW